MKRLLFLLVCLLLFVLSACGSNETKEPKSEEDSSQEKSSQEESVEQQLGSTTTEGESVMYPQLSNEVAENEALVEMNTTLGTIKIKLFPEYAPKTVENFLT